MVSQGKRKSGEVPAGITFGSEVLVLPSLFGTVFTHAGGTYTGDYAPNPYSWVKKGDIIAKVLVRRPKDDAIKSLI